MATNPYRLKNDYVTGAPPSASDLNRRANVLRAQLPGAFDALGEGVLPSEGFPGEDGTALEVTYDGAPGNGGISVAPGAAFVRGEAGHLMYVENLADAAPTGVETGVTNYIFIVAYLSEVAGVYDSETARLCRLVASDTDSYPGGLLLAEVAADNTVTDRRAWVHTEELRVRVAQLESDVGYDAAARAKGSVAERLDALAGEDGGAATITYLSQLKYSEDDPRSAAVVIEEKIAVALTQALDAVANGTNRPRQTVMDHLMHEIALIRQGVIKQLPDEGERSQSANVLRTTDGQIYGDGSNNHPDFITTNMTLDPDTGELHP